MLPFKLVYHDRYDLNLGPHVFPSQKFRLIYEMLLRDGIATQEDFLRPNPASDEDILRVHTSDWVRKLKTGTLTASDVMKLEVPYSRNSSKRYGLPPEERFSRRNQRCATDSVRISAEDFIMRILAMAKVSARFMTLP